MRSIGDQFQQTSGICGLAGVGQGHGGFQADLVYLRGKLMRKLEHVERVLGRIFRIRQRAEGVEVQRRIVVGIAALDLAGDRLGLGVERRALLGASGGPPQRSVPP